MPHFLSLPREIRDTIYDHVLTDMPSSIPPTPTSLAQSVKTIGSVKYDTTFPRTDKLALVLTNKQIKAELEDFIRFLQSKNSNPDYALHIFIGTQTTSVHPIWLHFPFLWPTVNVLDVWVTVSETWDSTFVWDGLLDILDRFLRRGPGLLQPQLGSRLMRWRRKIELSSGDKPWPKHPDYFFVKRLRLRISKGHHGQALAYQIGLKTTQAALRLMRDVDPSRANFQPREYTGQLGTLLMMHQCCDWIEIMEEWTTEEEKMMDKSKVKFEFELEPWRKKYTLFYSLQNTEQ